ncbi:MAG: TetR/AcrR family transcriptional regulator [Gordonia sp. (in: high G+C Gram-positive bacteria)]|uniref:TetR/AcrR family transcriptional regulator n=1 Tax=Gordonia sp. (in: high G+C Gram-positive bacteria) TaxID=84139 RepID=UPI003BB497FF
MALMPAIDQSRHTRERLLDAAEELLLGNGYETVSVRAICARADANPAAVHYHFGSKEELVTALLEARLAPLWAGRLADIPDPPTVTTLVETILAPLNELLADPVGRLRLSLLSRFVLAHPTARWQATWFDLDAWACTLSEAVPGLDAQSARRRCRLAFALLLAQLGPGTELPPTALAALREFLIAGLTGTGAAFNRPAPDFPATDFRSPTKEFP